MVLVSFLHPSQQVFQQNFSPTYPTLSLNYSDNMTDQLLKRCKGMWYWRQEPGYKKRIRITNRYTGDYDGRVCLSRDA